MQPNSSDLMLVPYIETDNGWSISDQVLAGIWMKMKDQDLLKTVWFTEDGISIKDFLELVKDKDKHVHTVWTSSGHILGLGWLSDFEGKSAQCHFVIFKEAWGDITEDVGKLSLKYWFKFHKDGEPLLRVIIGGIPETNNMAIGFAERMGFKNMGTIPYMDFDRENNKFIGRTILYKEHDQKIGH